MTDGYFSFDNQANTYYPIPSNTVATGAILQLADPIMMATASFFSQLLNTNLMPRFAQEAAACGLTHSILDNFVDNTAVAQTIVFPLNEQLLRANDFKFPLLAIQPDSEEFMNWTLSMLSTKRTFKVAWMLPPLSAPQYNRMYPFFGLATKTLLAYGSQGYDPKVNPTGPSVWQTAGLSFGYLGDVSYEPYKGLNKTSEKVLFPTIEMEMMLVERNQNPVALNYLENFNEISTLQINLVDGYSPANPIVDFVDGYVIPNITITKCTPNTGSIQGNTLIVIEGTGFDAGKNMSMTVCGSPVNSLTVKSSTVLMAITTAVVGYNNETGNAITGDIVITDNFGNTYDLTNGYSYTYP